MADYHSLLESIEYTYPNTQKPIYMENHIYKRRNRRSILAKRKGAEARRCAAMRSVRLSTFDMVLPC